MVERSELERSGSALPRGLIVETGTSGVDLFRFDEDYLDRLRSSDPETEQHFSTYFGRMLTLKLRNRLRQAGNIDDLKQETLLRVLRNIRSATPLREAEKLGAYVNTTCNYVLLEYFRAGKRESPLEEDKHNPADATINLESAAVASQVRDRVQSALEKLDPKDRKLLSALFIEERDKDEICREFRVDRDYLRVLLYRAKAQFRNHWP